MALVSYAYFSSLLLLFLFLFKISFSSKTAFSLKLTLSLPHWGLTPLWSIGRKNFVMIESSNGAKASAILYSLVETAKANLINTFEYFNLLLTEIPQHMDDKDLRFIDDLLPWSPRVLKECPSRYKKS